MKIAIIPARGGSKRIPRKNIRIFAGKPIIGYSIETAIASGLFDDIIISTDDHEVAEVAKSFGASVPFLRPNELSCDYTPTLPVIRHAIEQIEANAGQVELACCIYPTAPFLRAQDLADGFRLLKNNQQAEFAFSVTSFSFPIFRSLKIEGDRVGMFWPEHEMTRSQDLPEAFHDAGQFYWGTRDAFLHAGGIYSANSHAVVLPRYLVQDIDTEEDWIRAEQMYLASQFTLQGDKPCS
ncbi:pseudaminic acid cytidylyltransferase [Blastopirellula marina]|uniref:Pseudaminic acid cytidylyltransferase n=1 Tax=Blastopirellula marina TaxID=124 RepID=A0A2S8G2X3_9BACT|nr:MULTISPECIES: pseudaminic acid cytidylyltransferase [Pirellulaceae]PQO38796.1 pseudaminic acid cytidylyltransferase [Blastopirellula marina]RCS55104.1 pseudaminic acid cytidylyltransferase [Bremerella cremea]